MDKEKSRLAEILGVEEDQPFYFGDCTYRIRNNTLQCHSKIAGGWSSCGGVLADMIHCVSLIKLTPKWDEETIKDAEAAIRLFGLDAWTVRGKDRTLYWYEDKPKHNSNGDWTMCQKVIGWSDCTCFPGITFENSPQRLGDIVKGK